MSGGTGKPNRSLTQARTKARRLALQALYQWDLSGTDLKQIEQQFRESEEFPGVDEAYFLELLHRIPARLDEVEAGLADSMGMTWAELDPVERAVLRVAGYELKERWDIPYKVVINEAVNLAKKFGAEQAHRFVNGVLDQAARGLRPVEHPEGSGGEGMFSKKT